MGRFSFLDQLEQNKEQNSTKKKVSNKGDFHQKCQDLLEQIKQESEEKYQELHDVFKRNYFSANIPKKRIMGFYGQLKNEMSKLRAKVQDKFTPALQETAMPATPAPKAAKPAKASAAKAEKPAAKAAAKPAAKEEKKEAKKVTKAPAKKAAAKPAEKKVAKKAATKAAPKAAKKTAKKTAKKK